jgi:predicted MFS family arabinose efflux permease
MDRHACPHAIPNRETTQPGLSRITSLNGTVQGGAMALGALVGGALAAVGGIRAPMLTGARPISATVILLAWRHRATTALPG